MPRAKYKKRKDGRYATTVTIGYKDSGKPIKKPVYGKTIDELEKNKNKVTLNAGYLMHRKGENITFSMYSKNWFYSKKISVEFNTSRMYSTILKNYVDSINNIFLNKINREDIQKIINSNKDKPRTCEQIKITLNQIFEQAIDDELVVKNPCRKIVLPKYKPKEKRPLTETEDNLTNLDLFQDKEKIFILLAKFYGLRKSEILGLTIEHFNFKEEKLTLKQALIFKGSNVIIKNLKSKNGYRSFYLFHEHAKILKEYFETLPNQWLFRNKTNDSKITPQGYRKLFDSIKKKIKANALENNLTVPDDLSAHIFRHNYATMLYKADVSVKDTQYLLGHATPDITLNIYTHLDKEKTDVRDKLRDIILKDRKK